jgi:ferrous iron transport protein A
MRLATSNHYFFLLRLAITNSIKEKEGAIMMPLTKAEIGKEYIVSQIDTDDEELNSFLFSLGCYSGEPVTVVSRRRKSCVLSIKDGRYNIDDQLAGAIFVH